MADMSSMAGAMSNAGFGGIVAKTAFSVYADLLNAKAKANQLRYQAAVATINQTIAKQNADYERKTGEVIATNTGLRDRFQLGTIKTVQSGSGLDVNSGSGVQVRESQHLVDQMDLTTIRSNAAHRAYGYDIEAASQGAQAGVYGTAANNAMKAGGIDVIGSIIGGAASVSDKWAQAKSVGLTQNGYSQSADNSSGDYGG